MSFSLWALYLLGAFYTIAGLVIARRATKPSCRNCCLWQQCSLTMQLGKPGPYQSCTGDRAQL